MPEKIKVVLITTLCFVTGFLGSQVHLDSIRIRSLERQIAAERAHSATCNWSCPSTLRDHDAEASRQIDALRRELDAQRREWLDTDPAEVCSLTLVRSAAREFPRHGPRPTDAETIDARVYELARNACIAFRYMREAHPDHIGYQAWVEDCAAAEYRSAIPGIPSRMLTPTDPDEEVR